MVERDVEGGMIEIGDPAEEPKLTGPAPRVVIEYRERGVPWMLVPPLLILSAAGAILLSHKFAPRPDRPPAAGAVKPVAAEGVEIPLAAGPLATGPSTAPPADPSPTPTPEKAAGPAVPVTAASQAPGAAAGPSTPAGPPPTVDEPPAIPGPPADPPAMPRPPVGFDPNALEADRKPGPTPDEAIAAASKDLPPGPGQGPDRPAVPVDGVQPTEVDPEILPPDPRMARARQEQRLVDAIKQVEADRARFHADLKAVCRRSREKSGEEIGELVRKYGAEVEPASREMAFTLLNRKFAGADRATRVDILRASGFPESLILVDLYDNYEKGRLGERDGPRNDSEAKYRAALSLLRHPPGPKAGAPRAAPAPRPVPTPGVNPPAMSAGPGAR